MQESGSGTSRRLAAQRNLVAIGGKADVARTPILVAFDPGCVKTRRLWLGSRQQLARAGLCHARIASINPPTPRMRITRFML